MMRAMPAGACLDEATAIALAAGQIAPDVLPGVLDHVDGCEACRVLAAEAARGSGGSIGAPVGADAGAPATLGRFVVEAVAGAGAMGVVYRGYDPRLERPVALKVIRHAAMSDAARARFEREAQALARVSHPHVIAVYEVGDAGDATYIAMAYAAGGTLAGWLAAAPRTTAAIVAAFRQAAEGLAAAHQAGLVHRDVKPSNLLVDEHGRVKVSDFGLAGLGALLGGEGGGGDGGVTLTRTGMVLGTPAYMSPEQHAGGAVDPRSDQWSLCVALYEAVAGHRPFAGDDLAALAIAVREPPRAPRRSIPRALARTLRRGLATLPEDRFASMRELADALAPPRRGRWIAAGAIALAAAGAAAFVIARDGSTNAPASACADAPARWNAVAATARLDGDDRTALDDLGTAWQARYRATCTAGDDAGADARVLQRLCLDDALARTAATLATPPEDGAGIAARLADARERLDRCDAQILPAGAPPTGDAAIAAAEARAAIARAETARTGGDREAAAAAIADAIARADASGYAPVRAEARLARAELARTAGDHEAAIAALVEALGLAQTSAHHRVLREASDGLAWLWFFGERDPAQARHWLGAARGLDARVPPTRYEQAMRDVLDAHLRAHDGDADGAIAALDEVARRTALQQIRGDLGTHALEGITVLLFTRRRFAEVAPWIDRLEHDFGTTPLGAYTAARLRGRLAGFEGRPDDAIAALERALALHAAAAPSLVGTSARTADLVSLARLHVERGQLDAAEARLAEAAPDATPAQAQDATCLRARIAHRRERLADAEDGYRACLRLLEANPAAGARTVALTAVTLGQILAARGQHAVAAEYLARGLERLETTGADPALLDAVRRDLAAARARR